MGTLEQPRRTPEVIACRRIGDGLVLVERIAASNRRRGGCGYDTTGLEIRARSVSTVRSGAVRATELLRLLNGATNRSAKSDFALAA
jgi:hypothetical protein